MPTNRSNVRFDVPVRDKAKSGARTRARQVPHLEMPSLSGKQSRALGVNARDSIVKLRAWGDGPGLVNWKSGDRSQQFSAKVLEASFEYPRGTGSGPDHILREKVLELLLRAK